MADNPIERRQSRLRLRGCHFVVSSSRPAVLIVDDEPLILSTYSMILREEGYEVSGCDSYVCGEKQVKERSYDAAVTGE